MIFYYDMNGRLKMVLIKKLFFPCSLRYTTGSCTLTWLLPASTSVALKAVAVAATAVWAALNELGGGLDGSTFM